MFKKYMLLEAKNGGLIFETNIKNPKLPKTVQDEGIDAECIVKGHNLANPIPYTMLSNMLISLMGGVPVPTNPKKRNKFPKEITRPEVCDLMAKNSYYTISSPINFHDIYTKQVVGTDGEYYGILSEPLKKYGEYYGEFMQSQKSALNSNRQCNTILFTKENGETEEVRGCYSFGMLLRLFNDDETHPGYVKMISFISNMLNVADVRKSYTFKEMSYRLYKMSKNEDYVKKVDNFYNEMKNLWDEGGCQSAWFYVIFHYGDKKTTSNTDNKENKISTKTYLRNRIGNKKRRIPVNAKIIVPIYDETTYNAITNGKGYCTFLDGGLCEITMIENNIETICCNYEIDWNKISDQEPPKQLENECVI